MMHWYQCQLQDDASVNSHWNSPQELNEIQEELEKRLILSKWKESVNRGLRTCRYPPWFSARITCRQNLGKDDNGRFEVFFSKSIKNVNILLNSWIHFTFTKSNKEQSYRSCSTKKLIINKIICICILDILKISTINSFRVVFFLHRPSLLIFSKSDHIIRFPFQESDKESVVFEQMQ